MLLQISKYTPKSLRVDVFKLKKSSLVFESTTVEETKIKESVLLWTKVTFYRADASWYTIETVGGPQGQCNNIYSSTKIFTPVQQYLFQNKINHPSSKICIPVQIYLSQYNNIYLSTKIFSHYKTIFFQYNDIYPSTKIFIPVLKYLLITEIFSSCKIFPMLHCSRSKVPAKTR